MIVLTFEARNVCENLTPRGRRMSERGEVCQRGLTYHADAFKSKDGGAEEKGQLAETGKHSRVVGLGSLTENVVECDSNAHRHEHIGEHRKWCHPLEVADQVHQDERQQQR